MNFITIFFTLVTSAEFYDSATLKANYYPFKIRSDLINNVNLLPICNDEFELEEIKIISFYGDQCWDIKYDEDEDDIDNQMNQPDFDLDPEVCNLKCRIEAFYDDDKVMSIYLTSEDDELCMFKDTMAKLLVQVSFKLPSNHSLIYISVPYEYASIQPLDKIHEFVPSTPLVHSVFRCAFNFYYTDLYQDISQLACMLSQLKSWLEEENNADLFVERPFKLLLSLDIAKKVLEEMLFEMVMFEKIFNCYSCVASKVFPEYKDNTFLGVDLLQDVSNLLLQRFTEAKKWHIFIYDDELNIPNEKLSFYGIPSIRLKPVQNNASTIYCQNILPVQYTIRKDS